MIKFLDTISVIIIVSAFVLLFTLSCNDCFGESYVQGIKVTCTSQRFEIASHTSEDSSNVSVVKMGNGETIYYGFQNHDVTCHFGNHIAKATFATLKPRDRGQCGARPGSVSRIWLDGKIVIQADFNNDCYESLSTASFEDKKETGLVFKICGHTGASEQQDECFIFQKDEFRLLTKPLSFFPISEIKKKRAPEN